MSRATATRFTVSLLYKITAGLPARFSGGTSPVLEFGLGSAVVAMSFTAPAARTIKSRV
jgi:phosphotransferase system  glucose/maltose/N-acetylglucosamine-specific IIC component